MKILKLNVQFDGYYGGNVNEIMLLPPEVDGILFEKLEDGEYGEAVYLGDIAGKHSECYGDLTVETISLNELSVKEVTELIEKSDMSEFEGFFETLTKDFAEDDKYDEDRVRELARKSGLKDDWMLLESIYNSFINEMKEEYVKGFAVVTVSDSELERVVELLKKNGVEIIE